MRGCDRCRLLTRLHVDLTHRIYCCAPGSEGYTGGWTACDAHVNWAVEEAIAHLMKNQANHGSSLHNQDIRVTINRSDGPTSRRIATITRKARAA